MPCYHPLRAWRTPKGEVILSKDRQDGLYLRLPCGNCLGCRTDRAQSWALRCQLELQDHESAVFATLTYDDAHKPVTLSKEHLSGYIRRVRKILGAGSTRFFASGEYGEHTQRPHYHAILYGPSELQASQLEEAWEQGHVKIDQATPANIAYTAGYCSKKIGYKRVSHERVDPATGELYQWQAPFILMSRRPGIGAKARDKYLNAWRLYAVKDGHKMPVPRYYKQRWKDNATKEELEQLESEIDALNMQAPSLEELRAAEKIAVANQRRQSEKRNL